MNHNQKSKAGASNLRLMKDDPALVTSTELRMKSLQQVILQMEARRGRSMLAWLDSHAGYLQRELSYNPHSMRRYHRGEVIHANFGFNVGAELGGPHWGVIISDNDRSNPVVNVVPLGSMSPGATRADLHKHEVYLGVIPGINGKAAYAIPNQLRPLSKMRIMKSNDTTGAAIRLSNEQLDALDQKVRQLYTRISRVT